MLLALVVVVSIVVAGLVVLGVGVGAVVGAGGPAQLIGTGASHRSTNNSHGFL